MDMTTLTTPNFDSTHRLEALHCFASKLCSDWMVGERFTEVDECGCRGYVPPVEKMVQLDMREQQQRVTQLSAKPLQKVGYLRSIHNHCFFSCQKLQ